MIKVVKSKKEREREAKLAKMLMEERLKISRTHYASLFGPDQIGIPREGPKGRYLEPPDFFYDSIGRPVLKKNSGGRHY